jgi:hypothetical protein
VGSLTPTFVPARLVGLAVKHPCAFALTGRLPSGLRIPLNASVTLWEATAPVKLPTSHCSLLGLEPMHIKSGISPSPPPPPQGQLQRVPPILRMMCLDPMASCSKAPRGLFVLLWVTRIFTGLSISPGPSSRQCPDRYAFRAGRNLPDKEFRYLRTVIVTAAVYWGFGSALAHLPLTFQHWAGISPYTYSSEFAETYGFVNQSPGPFHCDPRPLTEQVRSRLGVPLLPKLRG